jgi:hypothetical protein
VLLELSTVMLLSQGKRSLRQELAGPALTNHPNYKMLQKFWHKRGGTGARRPRCLNARSVGELEAD